MMSGHLNNAHLAICLKDDTITVTQFHRYVSSLSKLTLQLTSHGSKSTIQSSLANQMTSRIVAELGKNVNVRSSS